MNVSCFPGNTFIKASSGLIRLQALMKKKAKPRVWTFNEDARKFELKKIKKIWSNGVKEVVEITLGKLQIRVTDNHKFLTQWRGWVEAKDLKLDDRVVCRDDKGSIKYKAFMGLERKGENIEVFDMEVEDNHNFLVVSNRVSSKKSICEKWSGVLAHNCSSE
jgi:intein/homing endonuclease